MALKSALASLARCASFSTAASLASRVELESCEAIYNLLGIVTVFTKERCREDCSEQFIAANGCHDPDLI